MSKHLTPQVQLVLDQATSVATELQHNCVGTEHLTLVLLEQSIIQAVLGNLGCEPEDLKARVLANLEIWEKTTDARRGLNRTPRLKNILGQAAKEAKRQTCESVKIEDLFIGILREEYSISYSFLREAGVTLEGARAEIEKFKAVA